MTKPAQPEDDKAWHLDKKVPVAMIVTFVGALLVQTVGIVWWASGLNNRVEQLETKNVDRDKQQELSAQQDEKLTDKLGEIAVSIATLTAKAEATNDKVTTTNTQINDIRGKVEALMLQDKTKR